MKSQTKELHEQITKFDVMANGKYYLSCGTDRKLKKYDTESQTVEKEVDLDYCPTILQVVPKGSRAAESVILGNSENLQHYNF